MSKQENSVLTSHKSRCVNPSTSTMVHGVIKGPNHRSAEQRGGNRRMSKKNETVVRLDTLVSKIRQRMATDIVGIKH